MSRRPGRYHVQKIYVIICATCNEDITRPLGGEDITTRAAADQYIYDHERAFHAIPLHQEIVREPPFGEDRS